MFSSSYERIIIFKKRDVIFTILKLKTKDRLFFSKVSVQIKPTFVIVQSHLNLHQKAVSARHVSFKSRVFGKAAEHVKVELRDRQIDFVLKGEKAARRRFDSFRQTILDFEFETFTDRAGKDAVGRAGINLRRHLDRLLRRQPQPRRNSDARISGIVFDQMREF